LVIDTVGNNGGMVSMMQRMLLSLTAQAVEPSQVRLSTSMYYELLTAFKNEDASLQQMIRELKADLDQGKNLSTKTYPLSFLMKYEGTEPPHVHLNIDPSRLVVLTNVNTYSAADMFAAMIQDRHLGLIVGEATGGAGAMVNLVKDTPSPNLGAYARISTSIVYRQDGSAIEDRGVQADIYAPTNSGKDLKLRESIALALKTAVDPRPYPVKIREGRRLSCQKIWL
jgi:hypothetical protein